MKKTRKKKSLLGESLLRYFAVVQRGVPKLAPPLFEEEVIVVAVDESEARAVQGAGGIAGGEFAEISARASAINYPTPQPGQDLSECLIPRPLAAGSFHPVLKVKGLRVYIPIL